MWLQIGSTIRGSGSPKWTGVDTDLVYGIRSTRGRDEAPQIIAQHKDIRRINSADCPTQVQKENPSHWSDGGRKDTGKAWRAGIPFQNVADHSVEQVCDSAVPTNHKSGPPSNMQSRQSSYRAPETQIPKLNKKDRGKKRFNYVVSNVLSVMESFMSWAANEGETRQFNLLNIFLRASECVLFALRPGSSTFARTFVISLNVPVTPNILKITVTQLSN